MDSKTNFFAVKSEMNGNKNRHEINVNNSTPRTTARFSLSKINERIDSSPNIKKAKKKTQPIIIIQLYIQPFLIKESFISENRHK